MPKYLIDYSVIVNAIYINGSGIKEDPFILPSHNVAIHTVRMTSLIVMRNGLSQNELVSQ